MSPELKSVYKCIKPVLPTSRTWVFSENVATGTLGFEQESEVVDNSGSGYTIASYGDSGSPLWKSVDILANDVERAILTSLISSKVGPISQVSNTFKDEPYHQCISKATKITDNILAWAKKWAFCEEKRQCTIL